MQISQCTDNRTDYNKRTPFQFFSIPKVLEAHSRNDLGESKKYFINSGSV